MDENENKETTKTITIKSAAVTDKLYLDKVATQYSCTIAEALTIVIKKVETADKLTVTAEETKKLTDNLQEQINLLTADKTALALENESLKNQKPEVNEKTVEVEKIVEVEKPLTGYQFIFDSGEEIFLLSRKYRKFIKEKNFKNFNAFEPTENETPEQYINRLGKFSILRFLKLFQSEYID